MHISQSDFASELMRLRPRLVQTARRLLRCSYEDAEDAVSDAVTMALARLDTFDLSTGILGLRPWLTEILYNVMLHKKRQEGRRPVEAPLTDAHSIPTLAPEESGCDFEQAVASLTPNEFLLLKDWMAGYNRDEIAARLRVHRNTVAARLEGIFAKFRKEFPDADTLRFSLSLFAACAQVSLYCKPVASWLPWEHQHPPEKPFKKPAVKRG